MVDGVECMKQANDWSDSDDPTHRARRSVDCNHTEQRPQYSEKLIQPQEELQLSGSLDLGLRVGAHWDGIDIAIRHGQILQVLSLCFQRLMSGTYRVRVLVEIDEGAIALGFGLRRRPAGHGRRFGIEAFVCRSTE